MDDDGKGECHTTHIDLMLNSLTPLTPAYRSNSYKVHQYCMAKKESGDRSNLKATEFLLSRQMENNGLKSWLKFSSSNSSRVFSIGLENLWRQTISPTRAYVCADRKAAA